MKVKITLKQAKTCDPVSVPYCALQHLLVYESPVYYYSNVYGWRFDIYKVDNLFVCTGYGSIGKDVDYELLKKYDKLASQLRTKEEVKQLLNSFIKEVRNLV